MSYRDAFRVRCNLMNDRNIVSRMRMNQVTKEIRGQ